MKKIKPGTGGDWWKEEEWVTSGKAIMKGFWEGDIQTEAWIMTGSKVSIRHHPSSIGRAFQTIRAPELGEAKARVEQG